MPFTTHQLLVFLVTAAAGAVSTPLSSAQTNQGPPSRTPSATVSAVGPTTQLAGQVELARLVDLCAQRLRVNVDYDAAAIKGTVTLRLEAGLTDAELWNLLNRLLAARGFTTVRVDTAATSSNAESAGGKLSPAGMNAAELPAQVGADAAPPTDQSHQPGKLGDAIDVSPSAKPSYSIVRIADAPALSGQSTALLEPNSGDRRVGPGGPPAGFTSVVVRTKHRTSKDLIDQVTRVFGGGRSGAGAGSSLIGGAGGSIGGTANLTPIGDTNLILVSDLSPRVDRTLELLALLDSPGTDTVVHEVALKHIGASQISTLLAQVLAKQEAVSGQKLSGEPVASPDGSSLLIIAPQNSVPSWERLIADLDKREEVVTRTYTPLHFAIEDVSRLIEQTIHEERGGTGRNDASMPRWKIVADPLTASLIITATPLQHQQIEELIARLEQAPRSARRPVRSFVIKNRPVAEVRSILEDLLRSGVLGAGSVLSAGEESTPVGVDGPNAARPVEAGASTSITPLPLPPASRSDPSPSAAAAAAEIGGSSRPLGATATRSTGSALRQGGTLPRLERTRGGLEADEPGLVFTIDEGTNTLIAVGEPRLLAQVEALLATLDVRQPQVMLEVLMVTLSEDQSLSLGAEIEQLTISNNVRLRLSSLFGLGVRSAGGDRDGPANAAGFTGVVLSPGDFSVVIRALERLNNGRSISMPRLLVGNNQAATLNSVVQQPYASVNASNTVSTTSFGGTSDAGTVVNIEPQIAEGDHLILSYSVTLSSFTGAASDPTLPPPKQQNQVQSVATIPDGSTVVVGGIEVESESRSRSQVPFIGNVPLIGEAFKSRSKSSLRSRFYVFIRANILRGRGVGGETSFEDLKYLSAQDSTAAGIDDGFPDVTPRVIR